MDTRRTVLGWLDSRQGVAFRASGVGPHTAVREDDDSPLTKQREDDALVPAAAGPDRFTEVRGEDDAPPSRDEPQTAVRGDEPQTRVREEE